MRSAYWCVAALVAILVGGGAVRAADTLVYSFESPAVNPDGFGPNGGGVTVTQDTIGATVGTHSLKTAVVTGATFVGALGTTIPPAIGNPPGVDHVLFDMTIGPNDVFTGGFSVIGVTIFGASQPGPGQQFGLQAQFADFEHIDGKAAGTYKDIRIDLTSATNPVDFTLNQSFNQIVGSGANQIIPTGFQFFINKSNDASQTIYIDNVRVGGVPEPASCVLLGMGAIGFAAIARRRFR